MSSLPLLGAIEAGGTKFILGIGTGPDDVRDTLRLPTATPKETLAAAVRWFQEAERRHGKMAALGVGTFGPAGVHPGKPDYGFITTTPKAGWANTDVLGALRTAFDIPMAFDTDVNAAALGEWRWGAGQGCNSVLYLTVGTGIGGGALVSGRPIHGLLHPEMGHLRLPRASGDDFPGVCPWHGDCLEGMASGPALLGRWGPGAADLPVGHSAWEIEAHYLASACANFVLTLSPERVILGGGVMGNTHLLPLVREKLAALLNGYLSHPALNDVEKPFLTEPGLGSRSGLVGALALAADAPG